jgi:hypothetical protein
MRIMTLILIMQISALISDFDGTLCLTSSLKCSPLQKSTAKIPQEVQTSIAKNFSAYACIHNIK